MGRVARPVWMGLLAGAVLTLLLMWPAFVNRQPFLYDDTSAYVRGFDAAIYKLTGRKSAWTSAKSEVHAAPDTQDAPAPAPALSRSTPKAKPAGKAEAPVVLSGRSIYYGALLYLSYALAAFWPLAILQAGLAATAMLLTLRRLRSPDRLRPGQDLAIAGAVALLTPAALFSGLMMPDIFGALTILAAASLLSFWQVESRRVRLFWFLLLTAALLFHSANTLLAAGILFLALVGWATRLGRPDRAGLLAIVVALLAAQAGDLAFSAAVRKTTGHPPIRPPFVTARLIDDGPGMDYLRRTCPGNGFTICAYLDRLPVPSDKFLWIGGRGGVFNAVPPAVQRRLSAEDMRFALAVVRDRPGPVILSTLRSIAGQLGTTELTLFNYAPFRARGFDQKMPAETMAVTVHTRAYARTMPVEPMLSLVLPVGLLSLAAIAAWLWRHGRATPRLAGFAGLVVAAFLLNAAICGALSTPHGRYQNRLIWVLPLVAAGLWIGRRREPEGAVR